MIHRKSSVTLCDCLCDKLIFTHKKSIPKNISNFFSLTTFGRIIFSRIAFTDMYVCSGGMGYFYYIPSRIISIYVPGLSAVERKKKVRICIIPNTFVKWRDLQCTFHMPLFSNTKVWRKVPRIFSPISFPKHECEPREM